MTSNLYKDRFWSEVVRHISASLGEDQVICSVHPVYGGDINASFHLVCQQADYFVKTNAVDTFAMFQAERFALEHFSGFAPMVICEGVSDERAFLVLEYIELSARGDHSRLGQHLAAIHRRCSPDGRFGWEQDNFIGTTPQFNDWRTYWSDFWWEMRLRPQLDRACKAGFADNLSSYVAPLREASAARLAGHQASASLLHGDLWSGNKGFLPNGEPIVFDPAAYYGDPETDLAMTRLFGGFDEDFYTAYHDMHPQRPGAGQRVALYQLYHLLNHVNLFGASYLGQCTATINRILAK